MTDFPLRARMDDSRLGRPRRFLLNRWSHPLRKPPDFLIIGEMKAGTTSLFSYLLKHPAVRAPYRKEIHYYSIGARLGRGWYLAHFPLRSPGNWITGEACPDYLFAPGACGQIHNDLPAVRLVVVLRDPIERAISHYFHEVRMGREYLPILDALQAEEGRLRDADPRTADGLETLLHASYKQRGLYTDHLGELLEHFPREQLLVIGSKTLFQRPREAVMTAHEFLDLEAVDTAGWQFKAKNTGGNRKDVPDAVREYLEEYFQHEARRLGTLLGKTLDW